MTGQATDTIAREIDRANLREQAALARLVRVFALMAAVFAAYLFFG